MTRTISKIVPCTAPGGLGLDPGLVSAVHRARDSAILGGALEDSEQWERNGVTGAAAWFRSEYDAAGDADIVEFAPLGRRNDSDGRWAWPSRSELESVYMEGFKEFSTDIASNRVRASFGRPRHLTYRGFRKDMDRMAGVRLQFDDMGSHAPKIVRWLRKYGEEDCILETVPTDCCDAPRLATRFDLPEGYKDHIWRVRADIVRCWVERSDAGETTPIRWDDETHRRIIPNLRVSMYLPAKDCEKMSVDTLERILPLFVDCTLQGPIPDAHMQAIRAWREAGPIHNTGGSR